MSTILYYFHDPMCSWCWGYQPTWKLLKQNLPAGVRAVNVLGGLAPDTDQPMPMEMQHAIQGYWRNIQSKLGTEFNYEFWQTNQPRRATYKACRAVIAASNQEREDEMIEAIQHGYYLRAMNPSETDILVQFADELSLDTAIFAEDLESSETHQKLSEQMVFTRQAPISGFPSLALHHENSSEEAVLHPVM